ncbi:hypothetical protein ACLOJK_032227 [Asimina triloba]
MVFSPSGGERGSHHHFLAYSSLPAAASEAAQPGRGSHHHFLAYSSLPAAASEAAQPGRGSHHHFLAYSSLPAAASEAAQPGRGSHFVFSSGRPAPSQPALAPHRVPPNRLFSPSGGERGSAASQPPPFRLLVRSSRPLQPGLPLSCRRASSQIQPVARSSQIQPDPARSSQIQPDPARSSHIHPDPARSSQIQPHPPRSSQKSATRQIQSTRVPPELDPVSGWPGSQQSEVNS